MKKPLYLFAFLFLLFNVSNAAVTKGITTTTTEGTDASGNLTISHQHNTGSNGLLIVSMSMPTSATINSIQYDSVSMTLAESVTIGSYIYRVYTLANPSTGTNDLVIDTDTAFITSNRTAIQSFTGAILGTTQTATTGSSPVTDSITVSQDAKIYLVGMYGGTSANTPTLKVNSVTLTKDFQLQFVYTMAAALSAAQSAGAISVECSFPSATGNLISIELEESGVGPAPRRIIMF